MSLLQMNALFLKCHLFKLNFLGTKQSIYPIKMLDMSLR